MISDLIREPLVTLAITFVAWIGFVWAIKADTKVLKVQVQSMEGAILSTNIEIKELQKVMITLADHNGRMNVIDERMLAQGKRLDDLTRTRIASIDHKRG